MPADTQQARWFQERLWLGVIIYWLVAMGGASVFTDRKGGETGWITLVMLVSITGCMLTERGRWETWKRVGYVFLAWVLQSVTALLAVLTMGNFLISLGHTQLVDRAAAFVGSLPWVVIAMYQSRFFVKFDGSLPQVEVFTSPSQPQPPSIADGTPQKTDDQNDLRLYSYQVRNSKLTWLENVLFPEVTQRRTVFAVSKEDASQKIRRSLGANEEYIFPISRVNPGEFPCPQCGSVWTSRDRKSPSPQSNCRCEVCNWQWRQ